VFLSIKHIQKEKKYMLSVGLFFNASLLILFLIHRVRHCTQQRNKY